MKKRKKANKFMNAKTIQDNKMGKMRLFSRAN